MVLRSDCELGVERLITDLQLGLSQVQNAFKYFHVFISQMCARFFARFSELSMSDKTEVTTPLHTGELRPGTVNYLLRVTSSLQNRGLNRILPALSSI